MSDYPSIPVPDFQIGTEVKPRNVIKSTARGLPVRAGTLAGGQGLIAAGTVLGVRSNKLFYKYDNTVATGEEVAVGVYLGPFDADTGTASDPQPQQVRIAMPGFGELFLSAVSGADANAITDLGARTNSTFDSFVF